MRIGTILIGIMLVVGIGTVESAFADDWKDRSGKGKWWRGEWKEEFRDGPCEVKIEAKRDEFKREVKCKDGVGARWRGEWKEEYWDGPCKVKIEAKRDEFKEEVKCERNH
jgi:hypothetical protein